MYHLFRWTRSSKGRNVLTQHYEPIQPHLLMALAKRLECETFIDVGANIGAYSLLMTSLPNIRKVHAFEPSPETFSQLRQNVALNGLEAKVHIHDKAISDQPKGLRFGIVNPCSGANSIIETSIHAADKFEREVRVEAVRLDDYLPERGQRICMKIDVEGHEREALAGMAGVLASNEIVLQVEDFSDAENELVEQLKPHGLLSLFRVGADRYFTNVHPIPTDREIVEIFEAASSGLVQSKLAILQEFYGPDGVSPVDIRLSRFLKIQLLGSAATLVRRVRALLKPSS